LEEKVILLKRQLETKRDIERIAEALHVDPSWAVSIAMVESSLGEKQKSPTGCRGVFQMSSIAMKDLLQAMTETNDDLVDIACGLAFLRLLLSRHKTIEAATAKFCDPADREFYIEKVLTYMNIFEKEDL
jgi:hypothetical protein